MFGHPRPIAPQPGQESVWDYPRPPRCEPTARHLQVFCDGVLLAETRRGYRVLETSHPPVYYFPPADVQMGCFQRSARPASFCEWKGHAIYYDLIAPVAKAAVAWAYPNPTPGFTALKDCLAFYPQGLVCTVDGMPVQPQPGQFYGGWITPDVVGPFKGVPGSMGW